MNEYELTALVQRRQMAFRLAVDTASRSATFGGGKKALRLLEKLERELGDES